MKRWFIGLSALVLVAAAPIIGSREVRAEIQGIGEAIVQAVRQPQVKLVLGAEKQIITLDDNGQEKVSWQVLEGQVQVQPGDVLRYTVDGSNSGDVEATNLAVTQPIPAQTTYRLGTANASKTANITFSIDGGQTFVAEPMVEVILPDGTVELQPAPAEAYTHVKWQFGEELASAALVKVNYEVSIN